VKKLSRVLGRVYDAQISAAGINITQLAVLRVIARRSGEPLIRIAEELEMDRTSLYRAISPMIREGWIVTEDGANTRSRTAQLTRKGRRLLADANKRWNGVQHHVIGRFGTKEYASLLSELNRLADCADGTAY
jgi:DNA-binding MarR family transcriptional regulator